MADTEALGVLLSKIVVDLADMKRDLSQGRAEMQSFKTMAQGVGDSVKKAFAFAGIAFGIYEIVSAIKTFGLEALETGKRIEVLRGAMYAIGENYQISAGALDLYLEKLTKLGVSTENALQSINNSLKSGLSIDLLPQLAEAAKNLAPTMAMPFNEAFETIIRSVTKGTPMALMELVPGIRQALLAASSETKSIMDSTILSGKEKSQIMVDFVLAAGAKAAGTADSFAKTYMKQLGDYTRVVREAKEALFEFLKPVSAALLGAQVTSWQELNQWIVNNRVSLAQLSEIIVVYIQKGVASIKTTIDLIATYKELFTILLEVWGVMKVMSWFALTEGAAAATLAIGGTIGKLAALRLALAGPWGLVIAVSVVGLYEAAKAIKSVVQKTPSLALDLGEAGQALNVKQQTELHAQGQELDAKAKEDQDYLERLEASNARIAKMSPSEQTRKGAKITPEEAKLQAGTAAGLGGGGGLGKTPKGGGGKGGGGGKEEDLFGEQLKLNAELRQAELQAAADSLDLLKSTDDKKRAELEKQLAEGLIDGQTYYAELQKLQEGETGGALQLIEKKRAAQAAAYKDALADLGRQDISPEMKQLRQQEEAAKNRRALAQLDTEAAKTRLDGEIKVTNELIKQVELRKKYAQDTETLNIETAQLLGAISEQEATLRKLKLEWERTKQEVLKTSAGQTPEGQAYIAAGDANLKAKQANTLYGGYAQQITQGISSLVDALMQGGKDLKAAGYNIFKGLFNESLKPGLEQLKNLLVEGFDSVFQGAGGAIGSAVMGAIGLLGMLLTSGGGSSYSPAGVTSGVTAHEAVRGIIAGDTSIPIAQISESLSEALYPTNNILLDIRDLLAGGGGGGAGGGGAGGVSVNLIVQGMKDSLKEFLDQYFSDYLLQGAN